MNKEDAELLEKLLAGDKQTAQEFYEKYSKLVYNFILATFRKYDTKYQEEAIEDLHSEVFVGFFEDDYKRLRQFEGRSSLATFVRTRTINLTIDHIRIMKRTASLDALLESPNGPLYNNLIKELNVLPDHGVIEAEDATVIIKMMLDELSDDERLFVRLYYFSGLNPDEIMERLNINRGSYDVKKQRVIEKLSECARKNIIR